MALQLELPAGESDSRFHTSELTVERCLGKPVCWRFVIHLQFDDERLPFLLENFESGQVTAQPYWLDSPLGDPSVVVGAHWSTEIREHLIIESHATSVEKAPSPAPDPDPFTPRWRVHDNVKNLLKLAQTFKHIATVPTWVQRPLEKVELAPGEYTSVLQDGLSDWAFFCHLLEQYGVLGEDVALKPPVMLGSVEEDPGKWLVTWGSKAAYEKLNDVSNRLIDFTEADETQPQFGFENIQFGMGQNHQGAPSQDFLVPMASRKRTQRVFTSDAWADWTARDLPLFTKEKERMVYRITDRLRHLNNRQTLGEEDQTGTPMIQWTTQLDPLAEGAVVAGPTAPFHQNTWIRVGTVTETQPKGPFIKVELEGFEDGANVVQARIQSPYTGTDGKKGLHLVPEVDTKVLLYWSGRFCEPVVVLGNLREEETEFEAPSIWLESLLTEQFVEITVKEIGKTTIESPYELEIQKETTVKSTGALKVTGEDTTDIESGKAFTLTGKDTTDVKSTGDMTLAGEGNTTVSAGGDLTADGGGATTVTAGGDMTIEGGGTTAVKGSSVELN